MADLGSALQSVLQVPGLQELLNSSITRQRELAPLRTAVTQQATNMLPNSAFTRPDIAAIPRANYSTPAPAPGTDWAKVLGSLGAGVGIGGLLAKLIGGGGGAPGGSGGGGNIGNIVKAIRDWRNGRSNFGTPQPFTGIPSYDPFNSNNGWNGIPPDLSGRQPVPNVDTSISFDPNQFGGGFDPYGYGSGGGGNGGAYDPSDDNGWG